MNVGAEFPLVQKRELFARLARGHSEGITVVTPNRRLAQTLAREFDERQIASGLTLWETADILPFGAFVQRLYEDALYSDIAAQLPLLLTPAQEQLLWEQIVGGSGLLSIAQTAAQCRDAWRLRHAWRIGVGTGNEDAAAFDSWSRTYEEKTRGQTDSARLPDLMLALFDRLKKPKLVVAYAFDILPPQTKAFLDKFEWVWCKPEPQQGSAVRTSFPSAKLELESAARWARTRLEQGSARIGVVVPELQRRREEVVRVFSRVMQPGYNLPGLEKAALPFNVSLGQPLADYPLVAAALDLIRFSFREIEFAIASRLIRSPFLGGAESEMTRRARLDARLRRTIDASVTLPKLIALVGDCPALRALLEAVLSLAKESVDQTPSGWARRFSALLDAAGFPGARALDSDEFQTQAKLYETLSELSRLQTVSRAMTFDEAITALQRLCGDTLFQPESGETPIQVLGILESAGLRFDCLWVSGLTDEAWPLAAQANPFLPIALQKKAGIPEASAEGSLELDRRLTAEWKVAAHEVVFSHAQQEADHNLAPSPLILDVAQGEIALPDFPRYRDLLFAQRSLESIADNAAPRVTEKAVRGGTRVLADHAACPFRAFARWRLNAEALDEPAPGLDVRDRGSLLHSLMKNIWTDLKSSQNLHGDIEPVIARAAAAAVEEMGIKDRFAELECARLARLAREWLELEKTRSEFEISALEEKRTIAVAGLEFSGRIDRMDKLAAGGHALIDYKTGNVMSPKQWDPPRPDEPQLALYAVSAKEDIAAVTFARVRPGGMKYMGYSRDEHVIPNVKPFSNWKGLLALWRKEAESLGTAFAAGDARVDPKYGLATCRLCDLQTLCRVYEKLNVLRETEE
ncbi:MAG TPA: PD-(D/E)XK nuclease family protein [Burkholderiales bacterium]|nr:PD-(D/E)XK nuclease family protein [Burkholderiales bacterium]